MPPAASPMPATPSTGSALMDRIVGNDFDGYLAEVQEKNAGRPVNQSRKLGRAADAAAAAPGRSRRNPPAPRRTEPRRAGAGAAVLGRRGRSRGCRSRRSCPISTSACSTNSSGATGRTAARSPNTRNGRGSELRPVLSRIIDIAIREDILVPQAAYGYWRCAAEGNDVILFDETGGAS